MHIKHLLFLLITSLPFITGVCVEPAVAATAKPDQGLFTVQSTVISPELRAYGQVTPIATLKIRALARGNLSDLEAIPGTVVTANQVLARLTGPLMQTRIKTTQQNLQTARARAKSAGQALHIAKHKFAEQLTTRQQLNTAISDLAAAKAAVQIATAQLHEVQNMSTLQAPVNGTVLSVQASNGEQTAPDQLVLTMLPANKLWLRAIFYGDDVRFLHSGISGDFTPSGSIESIKVKLVTIAPNVNSDSGRVIELTPVKDNSPPRWMSGTWGTLILHEPEESVISVPTSALILDHGKWWVLLHTSHGDIAHEVIPGIAHGWSTTIRSGLTPGQQIVVKDAYLRYHHGIARTYLLPD